MYVHRLSSPTLAPPCAWRRPNSKAETRVLLNPTRAHPVPFFGPSLHLLAPNRVLHMEPLACCAE